MCDIGRVATRPYGLIRTSSVYIQFIRGNKSFRIPKSEIDITET